jgi:glycine/D-amino acid oxidase-like deaminating enzyme
VATGFSGNGMTLGTFSAMHIRDLITRKSNPWIELFAPNRKSISGTWDYIVIARPAESDLKAS